MSAPHPPRKGAYTKHVSALHKDQYIRIQAKNAQEIELLDQIHTYMKKKTAIEKKHAEDLLKLTTAYLNHKIIPIPDIGSPPVKAAPADESGQTGGNTFGVGAFESDARANTQQVPLSVNLLRFNVLFNSLQAALCLMHKI